MNKKFSTLLCGALVLASFSVNAQYLKIQTGRGELVKQGDSTVLVEKGSAATMTAASLWKVETGSRATSGNLVYKFTNKATNTTLKLKGEEWFAVGEKDAVRHDLDTLGVSGGNEYKKLFTIEGGFSIATRDANWGTFPKTIVPDTADYANNDLSLILALPGDMTHWMTVAELNQCAKYMVPLFADMEGIEPEEAAYEFISTARDAQSTDSIFTIQSKTSDKFLAVDSTNVTANSTVNVGDPRQNEVFGFNVAFGAKSAFDHFGILFNPVNDSVAVAVMDKMLSWDVENKKLNNRDVLAAGEPVAWLGNARFINDEVEFITVDDLYNPTNGLPYWTPAPAQIEPGKPLADGLYILTAKTGKIWGVPYGTVCEPGEANNGNAAPAYTNEYVPENQWMITSTYEDGIYSYAVRNRFYEGFEPSIKKVTTCEDVYFILNNADTVSVKAIEANEGWKVFDGEELESSSFTLGLVNKYGADGVFMIMNQDSSLNAEATEEPLEFRAKFVGGQNFNLKTFATDTLALYHLYTLNANGDTLWIGALDEFRNGNINNNKYYTLTTKEDQVAVGFFFKAEHEGQYKMVIEEAEYQITDPELDCLDGKFAIRVHENGGTSTYTEVTNNDVSLFTINYSLDDAEYARLEAGHYVIIENSKGTVEDGNLAENEVLTKMANMNAKFMSIGDNLGNAAAIEENFSLWIDEACVSDEPGLRLLPTYYIMKGAEVDAESNSVKGDFLTIGGKYNNTTTNDNLVFKTATAKINDTMDKAKAAKNTFLFKITDVEDQYTIHPANNRRARMALINGVVVNSTDQNALPVVVKKASVIPTANEGVEVATVAVIAGEGQVTVAGAAGKKVVISNILGQVVANTVLTSDNATIAAPQGVVVVAVEGEEAVKAIVK